VVCVWLDRYGVPVWPWPSARPRSPPVTQTDRRLPKTKVVTRLPVRDHDGQVKVYVAQPSDSASLGRFAVVGLPTKTYATQPTAMTIQKLTKR
jgi:hypothetical protein